MNTHRGVVAALAILALVGCSGGSQATLTPSPTATAQPSPTAAPSQAGNPSPTSALRPSATPGAWRLVGISDSLIGGDTGDSGYEYARMVEDDLGVEVSIQWFPYGGSTSAFVLNEIRSNTALRDAVSSADVILFNVPTGGLKDACPFDAVSYQPAPGTPEEYRKCAAEMAASYATDSEAIMAEIDAVRRPDALVRTTNAWVLFYPLFLELGLRDVIIDNFRSINDALQDAADAHGIPVADAFSAFMGADGTTDPVAAGYLGDDQLHPTPTGHQLVARLWHDMGYEPTAPRPS